MNMVDSDTNVSTDFKSSKLTNSVLQRDITNLKKAETMLPVVVDLCSPKDSGTQDTYIVTASESPVKEETMPKASPAARERKFIEEVAGSSPVFQGQLFETKKI